MRIRNLLAAAVLGAAITTPASAQLGGLVRKAKEAAAQKAVESAIGPTNKSLKPSDAFGPELTAASLDGVLRGLAVLQASHEQTEQMRARRMQLDTQLSASITAHEKERESFEALRNKRQACQDSVIDVRGNAAQEAFMKRMQSDPAAQAEAIKMANEIAMKAAISGKTDSAEATRSMQALAKANGIDLHADSLAAVKHCGAIPPTPAWLTEQDSLRARAGRLDEEIRESQYKSGDDATKAAGMEPRAFALAQERVLHWYRETHGGPQVQSFGNDERKLLESRKADIEKYKQVLN
jgi:hypothetical protein